MTHKAAAGCDLGVIAGPKYDMPLSPLDPEIVAEMERKAQDWE